MLKEDTVLVLGAGASQHLDIPVGRSLIFRMESTIAKYEDEIFDAINRIQEEVGTDDPKIARHDVGPTMEDFGPTVRRSNLPSIDHFLKLNPGLRTVGRVVIAATLLDAEDGEKVAMREQGPSWLEYVWQTYLFDLRESGTGNLRIITLNYDRSVEYFIRTSLGSMYGEGIDELDIDTLIESFDINHLHGSLGSLDAVPYGAEIERSRAGVDLLIRAAAGIVLLDDDCSPQNYSAAQSTLRRARQIGFLGFGFDLEVLGRMFYQTRKIGTLDPSEPPPNLFGTAVGLTNTRRDEVNELLNKRLNGRSVVFGKGNCLDLVRDSKLLA